MLPNRISIAPFCKDCCHLCAGPNAQGRIAHRGLVNQDSIFRAHGRAAGGRGPATWLFWALETRITKPQSHYSSKWSPNLECTFSSREWVRGHLMTFQSSRCLLKKYIHNDRSSSTISFKHFLIKMHQYFHSAFHSAAEFFMMLFIEKQQCLLKAFTRFPWWFARHSTIQIKISSSSKATLMSYKRAPAWPWVGTIIQRGDRKLSFQKSLHNTNRENVEGRLCHFCVRGILHILELSATHLKQLKGSKQQHYNKVPDTIY